jgi:hypothetical protein
MTVTVNACADARGCAARHHVEASPRSAMQHLMQLKMRLKVRFGQRGGWLGCEHALMVLTARGPLRLLSDTRPLMKPTAAITANSCCGVLQFRGCVEDVVAAATATVTSTGRMNTNVGQ